MNNLNSEISNIRSASRQFVRELDILDGKGCIKSYSLSESHVLMELDQQVCASGKQLAELLVLEKSTISRIIARLESHGLVSQVPDHSDRRRKPFELTGKGRDLVTEIHQRANLQVREALSFISRKQRAVVGDALATYSRALACVRRTEGYQIRLIETRDDAAVCRIIIDVMTDFGATGKGYSILDDEVQQMSTYYSAEGARYFVIDDGSRLLGCGGVAQLEGGDSDTCELRKMYFLPELRGRGMGMKLILHCLEAARELGYRQCYLETLESMHQARALYRKVGFKKVDHSMGNTGHSKCNSWMLLDLEGSGHGA